MDKWSYPTSILVSGVSYPIRTDYRAVLDLFVALNDPECIGDTIEETNFIHGMMIMQIMIPQYKNIPGEHWQEAINKVCEFIDVGISEKEKKNNPKTMDWEKDALILIPEINKILGYEARNPDKYTHWWTFVGAYMGIGESLFSNIVRIRHKKAKQKKLDKNEMEFYKENKTLIDFDKKQHRSEEEKKNLSDYLYGYKKTRASN